MGNKLKTVDAETLLSTPMSKTMFIVDGLISQGVNVISGASKIGKKLADAVAGAGAASGAGKLLFAGAYLGFAHTAMRCALSEP